MPLVYESLTSQIIETAFEVSAELGAGFLESVYQNAFAIALGEKGLQVECEVPLKVIFRDRLVGSFQADLVVNQVIIVELKAVSSLMPEHKAQVINYLKASGFQIGLLINFGKSRIEFNRLEHPRLRQELPRLTKKAE
jgi:GxxExxY protein